MTDFTNTGAGRLRTVRIEDFDALHEVTGDLRERARVATLVSRGHNGSSDLMVGMAIMDPGDARRAHHHDDASEVYVVTRGELEVMVDGHVERAPWGTGVYIPAGASHSVRNVSVAEAQFVWAFNLPEREEHGLTYDEDEPWSFLRS